MIISKTHIKIDQLEKGSLTFINEYMLLYVMYLLKLKNSKFNQ